MGSNSSMILLALGAVGLSTLILLGYLLFIWWLDRYEREPIWVVALTFLWGALGGTCLSCFINSSLESGASQLIGAKGADVFGTVLIAPTIEELMKALVFIPLLALGRQVDNRTDGLIYGAATGLGFACVENLFYYAQGAPNGYNVLFGTIVMRTMFTSLLHCSSSAMLGMALGYASHRAGALRWILWPLLGYCCAVINHATWNGLSVLTKALGTNGGAFAMLSGILILSGVSLLMFILTQSSLHSEHKVIRHYLREEARRGFLPMEHAEIIPFWFKRRRSGWLPGHISKDTYLKTATLLAFRHHQLEIAQGERRQQYLDEIAAYRQTLATLLRRA